MKKYIILTAVLMGTTALAETTVSCKGTSRYEDTYEINGTLLSDTELSDISVWVTYDGESTDEYQVDAVEADASYKPRLALYKKMNRFKIKGEAYHEGDTYLLLPKTVSDLKSFKGYLSGRMGRVTLKCQNER